MMMTAMSSKYVGILCMYIVEKSSHYHHFYFGCRRALEIFFNFAIENLALMISNQTSELSHTMWLQKKIHLDCSFIYCLWENIL